MNSNMAGEVNKSNFVLAGCSNMQEINFKFDTPSMRTPGENKKIPEQDLKSKLTQ